MKGLSALLMLGLALLGSAVLTSCGSSSSVPPPNRGALAGNWQFTLTKTTAPHTVTLISGFLQQTGKTVTGSVQFTPPISAPPCGGSFAVSGTSDGQNVNLTINEGGASVTLTGTGGASSMGGSYNTVATGCGKSETGTFTATLIQPLSGTLQGVLHSTDIGGRNLNGADFQVTGQILQGDNVGASSAAVTGTLSAVNYPCFTDTTLSGTVTGNFLFLNIIGPNGAVVGHIGNTAFQSPTVTVRPDGSGFFGFSAGGGAAPYGVVNSSTCSGDPNNLPDTTDSGNICVDVGTAANCKQTLAFSQAVLGFNPTQIGTSSAAQTLTLTNQSSSDVMLVAPTTCLDQPCVVGSIHEPASQTQGNTIPFPPDFLVDSSKCPVPPAVLPAQGSCSISVTFQPTTSCPVFGTGELYNPPSSSLACPIARVATLSIGDGTGDPDSPHSVLLAGIGLDSVVSNVQEQNFGVVPNGTISAPATITLTNQGPNPVTITDLYTGSLPTQGGQLPPECSGQSGLACVEKCSNDPNVVGMFFNEPCSFVTASQVVPPGQAGATCQPPPLVDTCRSQTIAPGASCKVDVVFCPTATNFVPRLELQILTNEPNVLSLTTNRAVVQLDGQNH